MAQVPVRWKGSKPRTPEQQVALAVRIMDMCHEQDVIDRAQEQLGTDRAAALGRIDLTRNTLVTFVDRRAKAYQTPPLVDGLDEGLAVSLGDASATTLVAKYGVVGGRPMPSGQSEASNEALRYWLGATYSGVLVGHGPGGLYLEAISPDDLKPTYASDNPDEPTIIRHTREREVEGEWKLVTDVYDLTDPEQPRFYVYDGEYDITTTAIEGLSEAWPSEWTFTDTGEPFHRIVITGDNKHVYRNQVQVEGTLTVSVDWTYWHAMIRDAGHPQRNTRGLRLAGMDSDSEHGETGVGVSATDVLVWEDVDPERPGTFQQWNPGFDPKVTGEAIRAYELPLVAAPGVPVDFESTGGEPTESERRAMEELVGATFDMCRLRDSRILQRAAAISNHLDGTSYSEEPYGVLYRWEVDDALKTHQEAVEASTPEPETEPEAEEPPEEVADE